MNLTTQTQPKSIRIFYQSNPNRKNSYGLGRFHGLGGLVANPFFFFIFLVSPSRKYIKHRRSGNLCDGKEMLKLNSENLVKTVERKNMFFITY